MNLKYNLINPIIGVIFSLYFLLDTEKYTNQNDKEIINNFLQPSPFINKTQINIYDINIVYNYIINNINIKKDEMEFLNNLNNNCRFYIQGGAVRDALINHTIKDIDVKSNCPINIIIKDLPKNCKYKIINNVIRIFKPVLIDIAVIEDISCNDFTINSIYYDYKKKILQISSKIICPSYYTKYLYNRYINDNELNINVVYHKQIDKSNFDNVINISKKEKYKILIYGEISEIKGKFIIQKLINECLDFEFVIHGICDFESTINCKVNGVYKDNNLSNIINFENPDIILFASIFCETFCYALIPALESIYPIICPNYGSFIELLYGRKNTYYVNPYHLNRNKIIEIINNFNSNYIENDLQFLKIKQDIQFLTLNTLI